MSKSEIPAARTNLSEILIALLIVAILSVVATYALRGIFYPQKILDGIVQQATSPDESETVDIDCAIFETATDEHVICDLAEAVPQSYALLQFSTYGTDIRKVSFSSDIRFRQAGAGAQFNYQNSQHVGWWEQELPSSDPPFGVNPFSPTVVLRCANSLTSETLVECSTELGSGLAHSWRFEFDLRSDYLYFYAEVDTAASVETQVPSVGGISGQHWNLA